MLKNGEADEEAGFYSGDGEFVEDWHIDNIIWERDPYIKAIEEDDEDEDLRD